MQTIFEKLGEILNPNNVKWEKLVYHPDYALETLENGNISECIEHLRNTIGAGGLYGMQIVHEQLVKIQKCFPERYLYIRDKVFELK